MKFLVSLLGLGTTVGGVFIGSIQQNVLKTGKPYIDILFEEIEKDIRKFSEENPITEEDAKTIKEASSSSNANSNRKRRAVLNNEEQKELKNTLGVWTTIWISMLDGYVYSLWKSNSDGGSQNENLESRVFSLEDKQKALEAAEENVKKEKKEFEKKLVSSQKEIEKIYQKIKNFLQIMKLPKKYNNSTNHNTPYEEYVRKISQ